MSRQDETQPPENHSDAFIPLATICDAVGVPGELVSDLYEEIVHDDPGAHGHAQDAGEATPHPPEHLVAVAEAQIEAVLSTDGEMEAPPPPSTTAIEGDGVPIDERRPLLSPSPRNSRRRLLHVRDVSLDFAAALPLFEAIPERNPVKKATPHPGDEEEAGLFGAVTAAAEEDRAALLDNLMERAGSFHGTPDLRGAVETTSRGPYGGGGGSLRRLLASPKSGSLRKVLAPPDDDSFQRKIELPSFGAGRAKGQEEGPLGGGAEQHATFVILDTAASPPKKTEPADQRPPLAPEVNSFKPIERGHSILPELPPVLPLLERGLSILPGGDVTLPSDVYEVKLEIDRYDAGEKEEQVDVLLIVKRSVPLVGYLLLVVASLSLSTTGTALDMQGGVSPSLKAYWRMTATVLALFPFAVRSILRDGGLPKLTAKEWFLFLWCGLGYAIAAELFVVALGITSVMDVYIFANSHCLLFVVLKAVAGSHIVCREGFGALIGFLGGVICALDGSGHGVSISTDGGTDGRALAAASAGSAYIGDVIALVSACGTVVYLSVTKRLRPLVDLFVYMFLQFFVASFWLLGFMIAKGEDMGLSSDPRNGLWGWVTPRPDRLPIELWLVFVCNLGGLVGYAASMKYFEPIAVSCAMNLIPVLASIFAAAMGVEAPPGPVTLMGDAIVFGGTYMVISSEARTAEVTDLKETARKRGYSVAE